MKNKRKTNLFTGIALALMVGCLGISLVSMPVSSSINATANIVTNSQDVEQGSSRSSTLGSRITGTTGTVEYQAVSAGLKTALPDSTSWTDTWRNKLLADWEAGNSDRVGYVTAYNAMTENNNATNITNKLNRLAQIDADGGNLFENGNGATGTETNPWIIKSVKQMAFLSEYLSVYCRSTSSNPPYAVDGSYFKVADEVKSTTDSTYPDETLDAFNFSGYEWVPVINRDYTGAYSFNFDGNGKTFYNVFVSSSAATERPSFLGCWPDGVVKNFNLVNENIYSTGYGAAGVSFSSATTNPTSFENITVENSKIKAYTEYSSSYKNTVVYGIADNATSIIGCELVDSEVTAGGDYTLYGKIPNMYVTGLGVTASAESIVIDPNRVEGSIVKAESTINSEEEPTSRTPYFYVSGAFYYATNATATYENVVIKDSEIVNVSKVEANTFLDAADSTASSRVYTPCFYTSGVLNYSSGTSYQVYVDAATLDNVLVQSNLEYAKVDAGSYNSNNLVSTVQYTNGVGFTTARANYDNIGITSSSVLSTTEVNMRKIPTNLPTKDGALNYNSNTYNSMALTLHVAGVGYIPANNTSFENCQLEDSTLNADLVVTTADNSNYYPYTNSWNRTSGIGMSTSDNYAGSFTDCALSNCKVLCSSDISNGSDLGWNNVIKSQAQSAGIGRGNFYGCQIANTEVSSNAICYKPSTDVDGSMSGNAESYGIGVTAGNQNCSLIGNVDHPMSVSNSIVSSKSSHGAAYAAGMAYSYSANPRAFNFTNCVVSCCDITTTARGESSAVGMAYNTSILNEIDNLGFNFTDCEVDDVIIHSTSSVSVAHAIGMGKNLTNNSVNGGNTYDGCVVSDSELQAAGIYGIVVGMGYNSSPAKGGYNNYKDCETRNCVLNLNVPTAKNTTENDISAMGFNTGSAVTQNNYEGCSVTNVDVNADIRYSSYLYISGMGINTGATSGTNNYKDCVVDDFIVSPCGVVEADYITESVTTNSVVSGMGINRGSKNGNNYENCEVKNSTLKSVSTIVTGISAAIAVGLAYNNASIATGAEIKDCEITNCQIDSKSSIVTTTTTGNSYSAGACYNVGATKYVFKDCVVTNSSITANATNASAYAVGIGYNTATTYKSEYSDCVVADPQITATSQNSSVTAYIAVAYGIGGIQVKSMTNCIVGRGSIDAVSKYGNSFASGLGNANGTVIAGATRTGAESGVIYNSVTGCYNYSDVFASTEHPTYSAYSCGIGQFENIDKCSNFGKITGNYAAGITIGYDSVDVLSPLTVTNCINNGNIVKVTSEGGGTSYIAGIVSIYHHGNITNFDDAPLVLENNINLGGIYSKEEIDGTFKQVASLSSFLGSIYGLIKFTVTYSTYATASGLNTVSSSLSQRGTPTAAYEALYSYYSIKNNYSLVVTDGINGGLIRSGESVASLDYESNFPMERNGNSYQGVINGYFDANNSNLRCEGLYRDLITYTEQLGSTPAQTNVVITTNSYFDTTSYDFTTVSSDFTDRTSNPWVEWHLDNGSIPQVANSTLKYKMISYDLNGNEGTIPNTDIIKYVTSGEPATTTYGFTSSNTTITSIGYDIDDWITKLIVSPSTYEDGVTSFAKNTLYSNIAKTNYPILYLYATTTYRSYTINFANLPEDTVGSVTGSIANAITLNASNNTGLQVVYSGGSVLSTISWKVKVKDTTEYVNFGSYGTDGASTLTYNLQGIFNESFIESYADSSNNLTFSVEFVSTAVYDVSVVRAAGCEDDYSALLTAGGIEVTNGTALSGSVVKIDITPNSNYEIESVVVTVSGSPVSTTDVTFDDGRKTYAFTITANSVITVLIRKISYSIQVNITDKYLDELPAGDIAGLVEGYSSERISIGEQLPQLVANNGINSYRFVGWKVSGISTYVSSTANTNNTTNTINSGYVLDDETFAKCIDSDINRFVISAIFQKQYVLDVVLVNEYGETYVSDFVVSYIDENNEEVSFSNITTETVVTPVTDENGDQMYDGEDNPLTTSQVVTHHNDSGSYLIDERTFVTIQIIPNKRVSANPLESNIVGVDFGGNVAHVYLRANTSLTFTFTTKSLTIVKEGVNVETESATDGTSLNILSGSYDHDVTKATTGGIVYNPRTIDVNDALRVSYAADGKIAFGSYKYRIINVYILNDETNSYDVFENNSVVNDAFYDNYVNESGEVILRLCAIEQFNVSIGSVNLPKANYTVSVLTENTNAYDVITEKESYLLDKGVSLQITASPAKYYQLDGFTGTFEGETNLAVATVASSSDRSISIHFEKIVYSLNLTAEATKDGELDYTKTFSLGERVIISYTPVSNYQIKEWKLNGVELSSFGATRNGNTVELVATAEFLQAMEDSGLLVTTGSEPTVSLSNSITTTMNPVLLYCIIGAGVLAVVLFLVVFLLVSKSMKLKKEREENEKRLNDIARKFNIADMIKDLKK